MTNTKIKKFGVLIGLSIIAIIFYSTGSNENTLEPDKMQSVDHVVQMIPYHKQTRTVESRKGRF